MIVAAHVQRNCKIVNEKLLAIRRDDNSTLLNPDQLTGHKNILPYLVLRLCSHVLVLKIKRFEHPVLIVSFPYRATGSCNLQVGPTKNLSCFLIVAAYS